ncbi:hypothetical protein OC846_003503 [Tilletia horrida]|uniref:Uncharacterized protein n=1 Tax=Tilletia horrida TaxID=155126 RepID=A0AAN6GPK8_9BASI|nr:hypothetical protein OC846_003503 [Tilletia horrida]
MQLIKTSLLLTAFAAFSQALPVVEPGIDVTDYDGGVCGPWPKCIPPRAIDPKPRGTHEEGGEEACGGWASCKPPRSVASKVRR